MKKSKNQIAMTKEEAIEKLKAARERLKEAHKILEEVACAETSEDILVIFPAKVAVGRASSVAMWVEKSIRRLEEEAE